jgi:hypothetical protein
MNIIFKIVDYLPETEQIEVKFCRQNSPKSIDEYHSVMMDISFIDQNSNYDDFIFSIMNYGFNIILQQENEEPLIESNKASERTNSISIKDNLNKVICLNTSDLINKSIFTYKVKSIEL